MVLIPELALPGTTTLQYYQIVQLGRDDVCNELIEKLTNTEVSEVVYSEQQETDESAEMSASTPVPTAVPTPVPFSTPAPTAVPTVTPVTFSWILGGPTSDGYIYIQVTRGVSERKHEFPKKYKPSLIIFTK